MKGRRARAHHHPRENCGGVDADKLSGRPSAMAGQFQRGCHSVIWKVVIFGVWRSAVCVSEMLDEDISGEFCMAFSWHFDILLLIRMQGESYQRCYRERIGNYCDGRKRRLCGVERSVSLVLRAKVDE